MTEPTGGAGPGGWRPLVHPHPFHGDLSMGGRIGAFDWAATPLGPMADWPRPLRTSVDTMLAADQAMFIVWGPERILLYNDAYGAILGDKHPDALGRPFFAVWPELEEGLGPALERVAEGLPQRVEDAHKILPSYGRARESRLSLACTPLYDEEMSVAGALCIGQGYAALIPADRAAYEYGKRREVAWQATGSAVFERAVPLDETTYHSAQWAAILGYERSELPPYERFLEWVYEQIHPEDRERIREGYQDFLAGRTEGYGAEARIRHKQGHWVWVRWVARALERSADGRVGRLAGMMLDITDMKEREEALRRSEAKARLLARMVESSPGFIGISDAEGNPVWVNEAGLEMVGMGWEEARTHSLVDYFMPEDRDRVRSEILPTVLREGEWAGELDFRHHPSGSAIPVLYHVYSLPDPESGELTHIATITRDLTAKKQAEKNLRDSEERFRALVEATASMVWTADAEGKVVEDSPSWRAFTGQSREEWLADMGWLAPVHPDEKDSVVARWQEAQAAGSPLLNEIRIFNAPRGEYRWTLLRAIPLKNADGSIRGWVGMNTDITEQRQAEQRLREADRRKDDFLALLGHELRNPLTPIASAAQLLELKPGALSRQQLQQVSRTLSRQTTHLTRMVDDLLDLSRLERGRIGLQQEAVDLRALVPEAVESIPVLAEAGAFDFGYSVPDDPLTVEGDPVRLVQVLANLLDNATKYTQAGGWIRVEAGREAEEVVVRVRDNGRGIEPQALDWLFEPFERGASREGQVLGLGLGLPLVRRLMELQGGSVAVDSPGPGQGSVFTLRLPAHAAPGAEAAAPGGGEPAAGAGVILLVEDNPDVAESLRFLLEALDQTVRHAASGRAAAEAVQTLTPGLVLIDIGLPDRNGFEVARELRRTLGDTPLVALSGHPPSHYPDEPAEVFDDYLLKPPTLEALRRVMGRMQTD